MTRKLENKKRLKASMPLDSENLSGLCNLFPILSNEAILFFMRIISPPLFQQTYDAEAGKQKKLVYLRIKEVNLIVLRENHCCSKTECFALAI